MWSAAARRRFCGRHLIAKPQSLSAESGAPGTEFVPGPWVPLSVVGTLGAPHAGFACGSWVCLFLICHPACPERSRRDRSGPIFSSAPHSSAPPSPVIPTEAARSFLPRRFLARRAAQWRDRGTHTSHSHHGQLILAFQLSTFNFQPLRSSYSLCPLCSPLCDLCVTVLLPLLRNCQL
jgi:hypothetical protein